MATLPIGKWQLFLSSSLRFCVNVNVEWRRVNNNAAVDVEGVVDAKECAGGGAKTAPKGAHTRRRSAPRAPQQTRGVREREKSGGLAAPGPGVRDRANPPTPGRPTTGLFKRYMC